MENKKELPRLEAVYKNGSSVIIAKSAAGEKEFPVVMYTEKDFEKIDQALKKLDATR